MLKEVGESDYAKLMLERSQSLVFSNAKETLLDNLSLVESRINQSFCESELKLVEFWHTRFELNPIFSSGQFDSLVSDFDLQKVNKTFDWDRNVGKRFPSLEVGYYLVFMEAYEPEIYFEVDTCQLPLQLEDFLFRDFKETLKQKKSSLVPVMAFSISTEMKYPLPIESCINSAYGENLLFRFQIHEITVPMLN
jgi:hypothetical protein